MFRKGLDTFSALGGSWFVARVLAELGGSMLAVGNEAEAGRVWREALRRAIDIHATPLALEAQLTREQLEAAQARATSKTFEAAVEESLQLATAAQHQTAD